jgi:colanic acid biosynthesis glycosyl transferase WcaI
MKILIYSANYAPELTGIGRYSGEMAAWLSERGHRVRVIAAPPYYPAWKIDPRYRWPPYRRESIEGVDIWRAPLWVPKQPSGLARALHLASFASLSAPLALMSITWRPDVVLTVAPFLSCAPIGWLTARLCGARSWLHIQDFELDAAFGLGLLKGSGLRRFALACECSLLQRFDVVSTISMRMAERLRDKGVQPERVRLFPNWVDTNAVRPLMRTSTYRSELGIPDDVFVVLFAGTLGSKQGLELIPQAARYLAHRRDVLFVVCGDGAMKPRLQEGCAYLTNVRLLPLQPVDRLCELLNLADVHLLTQNPEVRDLVLPSKLTGMLASGRPVLATTVEGTEIASVLATSGAIVPPGDACALAAAVERLADDSSRCSELGERARAYAVRNFAKDVVLERVEQEMDELAAGRGAVLPDRSDRALP